MRERERKGTTVPSGWGTNKPMHWKRQHTSQDMHSSHLRWVRQKIIGRGLVGDWSGIGRGPLCENVCFAMVFARFAVWGRFG